MTTLIIFVLAVAGLALLADQLLRIRRHSRMFGQLKEGALALENHPEDPDQRILIIGDSVWAGVGALDPADSLAGRLITDLPNALVANYAETGARIADGRQQLATARKDHHEPFDQVIIQLGANDILYLSNTDRARKDLRKLLKEADVTATNVAYTVSNSIGFAPVFIQLLDWFYSWQTRRYLSVFSHVAHDVGVEYIDLYRSRENDPFCADPAEYYAADLFHPSGAGYGIWYSKCKAQLQCFDFDE